MALKISIKLTDQERCLFNILQKIDQNVEIRAAGGWVRDKLRATDHHECEKNCDFKDIDIVLDNMTGEEFAVKLKEHMIKTEGYSIPIGIIHKNPDKSKHLETATVKLNDISLDFTNLRTDMYCQDSRIPIVRFGSPIEDAHRRDFTINSLFYNINKEIIEDYTNRGLLDIQNKILMTPMKPDSTLRDDPLRLLRAVRFASTLNYGINQELLDAMKHETILTSIHHKVSKERIRQELYKLFASKNYYTTIKLCREIPFLKYIISLNELPVSLSDDWWIDGLELLSRGVPLLDRETVSDVSNHLKVLSYILYPTSKYKYKIKSRYVSLSRYIVTNILKSSKADANCIAHIHESSESWKSDVLQYLNEACLTPAMRVNCGCILSSYGDSCFVGLGLAVCSRAIFNPNDVISIYDRVQNMIKRFDLNITQPYRSFYNGDEIKKLFDVIPNGPQIKMLLTEQKNWILAYPNETKEECRKFLLDRYKHMNI